MAATKSAGRVSIRVLPDSTRFKQDLEKSLRRIEHQLKAKIEAELYLSRASLAKLKREIESLVVKIKPSIELNVSPEDLEALKAKIEKTKPKVDVLLDTAEASRRIAVLSRDRKMNLWVNVRNSKMLQNFARHMRGLAGLNVIGDSFEGALEFFRNVDTNSIKLAKLYSKIAALGAVAAASVGSISLMLTDIAAIGNIALLAPAFLSGMAISAGILVAAFKDMKTVLADLGPRFQAFQDHISSDFWGAAEQPIRDLVDAMMPILDNPKGTSTARSLGQFFGEIATSLKTILTADKLNTMFDRMNRSIDILKKAVKPLTNAFVNLGLHGSKYFERFSNWIVKISNQFDKFIERSAKNGNLDKWTENAIQGMKDLYGVAKGVWRIIGAVSDAARKAKLPDMGDIADGLNRAADTMGSPRFQSTLSQLFAGAKSAVDGMLEGVKKLGPAIESATPTIKRVLEGVGRIGSAVGGMLSDIIKNPKVQAGFEAFFAGIEKGVNNLKPAVKPFADSLGQAMKLIGTVIDAVSKLGSKIIQVLGPILDNIGNEFESLVGPFNDSLMGLVDDLKPVLEAAYQDFIKPLVKFIKEELLPALDKIGPMVGPVLVRGFQELGRFIREDLTPLFQTLNDLLDKLEGHDLSGVFDLPKLADPKNLMPGFNGGWLTGDGLKNGNFIKDWENFWRPVEEWTKTKGVPGIKGMFEDMMKNIDSWIKTDFGPFAEGLGKSIGDQLASSFGIPDFNKLGENLTKWWEGVQGMIEDAYNGFKESFQKWLSDLNPFDDILDQLFGKQAKSTAGLGGMGSKGVSGKITPEMIGLGIPDSDWLSELNATVNQSLADFWASIGENLASFGETVTTNWNAFWGGLGTKVSEIWTNITTWISTKASEIGANIASFIETVRTNWDSFWGGLPDKIAQVWEQVRSWIAAKASEIWGNITSFISDVGKNWDSFWNSLPGKISAVWAAIVAWIRQKIGEIVGNVTRFLGDVQRNMTNGWENVKRTVSNAWNELVGNVRRGVDDAIAWVRGLPGRAASALSGLGETLRGSGQSLLQGFINGMGDMLQGAKDTAAGIMQSIRNFFPFSPAKTGPFSGSGYTTFSGRALVKDFAGGMMDNMNKVRSATKAITGAVKLGANMDLNTDLGDNGITVDRREVTVKVYHPVAEPTSRTIEKSANTLRMAGAI